MEPLLRLTVSQVSILTSISGKSDEIVTFFEETVSVVR